MIDSQLIASSFLALTASVHFASIGLVYIRARRSRAYVETPPDAPAITILRPVAGIENHLEATFRSTFELDYPDYEVIFCAAAEDDPIVPLVRKVMAEYPEIPSSILFGDDPISINPKLNNLVKGWRAARHPWILMADSNALLSRDYLNRLTTRWSAGPDTGLVCAPPVGIQPESFAAELECAFLNTHQACWQFASDAIGNGFAQGKTMFWRREYLDEAGGPPALAEGPAEDAQATKVIRRGGRKIRLIDSGAEQPLGFRTFVEVWQRQVRWARLRRATFPQIFASEIISGGFLPLLAAVYLAAIGAMPLPLFIILIFAWYGAEMLLADEAGWPQSWRTPFALVFRDILIPAVWVMGWMGNRFNWRGNDMDMATIERSRRKTLKLAFSDRTVGSFRQLLRHGSAVAAQSPTFSKLAKLRRKRGSS